MERSRTRLTIVVEKSVCARAALDAAIVLSFVFLHDYELEPVYELELDL